LSAGREIVVALLSYHGHVSRVGEHVQISAPPGEEIPASLLATARACKPELLGFLTWREGATAAVIESVDRLAGGDSPAPLWGAALSELVANEVVTSAYWSGSLDKLSTALLRYERLVMAPRT
jgi:hypothetical protein